MASFLGLFVLVILTGINESDAKLVPKTLLDQYLENDMILVGKVTETKPASNNTQTEYTIRVEKYIKNPQDVTIINAYGTGYKIPRTSIEKIFHEGDRVLLLLNKVDGRLIISFYSINAEFLNPDSFILAPLKLYKAGIPATDIVCAKNLVLVLKSSNHVPVCVNPNRVEKLIRSDWAYLL